MSEKTERGLQFWILNNAHLWSVEPLYWSWGLYPYVDYSILTEQFFYISFNLVCQYPLGRANKPLNLWTFVGAVYTTIELQLISAVRSTWLLVRCSIYWSLKIAEIYIARSALRSSCTPAWYSGLGGVHLLQPIRIVSGQVNAGVFAGKRWL